MRTKARETVFEVIFASRFSDGVDSSLKNALYKKEKLDENDIAYADSVISLIGAHSEEFCGLIDKISHSFPESRLFPADISIMLVALAEIKYIDDIPTAVSINEAANMASKFSSPKSASFVSGILSEAAKG